ncbi:polysaccharide biosynthesis tyrosine autokinase [Anabaena sp. UHCC 0204]|uniref:GumC family protein n=1 Tax=Anabaena sp. UHCC 0204 TaxID=2590009 RepID=UPI0014482EC9|nr:polysaccharide biosynthesis tyrosine autokinase [Anabaena sp. UHCC 0204]MTJ07936.1 polysaccharide biosynthesis tyrosine autokinase [Anabaena sp. UHCC 0204]
MENHSAITSSFRKKGHSEHQSSNMPVFSAFEETSDSGDLRQILETLKRRSLVIAGISIVVNGGVTYSTLTQEPIYQGNFQLLVESVNEDSSLGKVSLLDSNIAKPSLDYESQIQVLKSPELLQGVIKQLQESYPEITYGSLLQDLTIRRFGATKVIEVSYKSHDTQKIKVVLDAISQFYLNYSLDKRQTKLRQGVQFADKQLPNIQNRVAQLQKEMQIFRQRYNFISPESQSETISGQIQSLTQQRLAVNQQLAAARANYMSLQRQEGQLAILNNAPLYQQLIAQQRQLDTQISGELARFQPENPVIQTLEEKRNNLLPIIQSEARRALTIKAAEATTLLQRIEVDSQQLIQAEQQLQRKLEQLPVLSRQYTDIQRNLQLANESLNRFLTNREQLQIEVAQTELPWELIQAPMQPESPISPNIQRSLLLGFVASSLLGVGAALILEKIDNTYQTVESIQEKIKLPLLGTLPFDKSISHHPSRHLANSVSEQEVVSEDTAQGIGRFSNMFSNSSSQPRYYGYGAFWESLQVLYGNIQLLNSDKPIRSLIISSAMSGDGKSTVAFNLAQIATSMGKRVLLVDADLRCSQVHTLSGLNNLWGLSNLISSNMDMEQVIQEMPAMKNLSVITAGPIPPDPARLLSSDKMKQLMDYFHHNFDLVIYDAPPMLGLVDVRLLAPYTDGLMLVVRIGKTDKSALTQVQDNFKVAPINLLGVVINGDKKKLQGYNYYYSDYNKRG